LRTRSWEDKEGNRKFATEVVGDNLIMLDKRVDGNHGITQHPADHNLEGFGSDIPPISDPPENMAF